MSLEISRTPISFREKFKNENSVDKREIASNNNLEKQPNADKVELGNNKAKTITIGVVGLGVAATVADFIFAKGKHFKKIFGIAEKEAKQSAETKMERTISDFKDKGGKFDKNKLINSDGTSFSGKLMSEGKDGKKFIYEYKDGILQKVETFQKSVAGDIPAGTKNYTYNSDGKIISVTQESQVMDIGKIVKTKKFEYNSDGKIKSIIGEDSNKIIDEPFEKYFNYDSNGNLTSIRTKTDKFVDGKVKTVEETKEVKKKGSDKPSGTSASSRSTSGGSSSSGRASGGSSSSGSSSSGFGRASSRSSSSSRASSSSSGSSLSSSFTSAKGSTTSGTSSTSSAGASHSTRTKSGKKTGGKTTGKTAEEALQEELNLWNSRREELMETMDNIADARFFIKDGKVMLEMIPTATFLTGLIKSVAEDAPKAYQDQISNIIKEVFEPRLKGIKLETSIDEIKKTKGKVIKEFEKDFNTKVMSEDAHNELQARLIKQYGENFEELFAKLKAEEVAKEAEKAAKEAEEKARIEAEKAAKEVDDALKEISEKEKAEFEAKANEAQAKYNKPFEDAKANKDAEDSMRVFTSKYAEQSEGVRGIVVQRYNSDRISPEKIKEYAESYGFKPVNYTATFADGTSAQIIYEGLGYDITSDGRLLKKVFAGSKKTYEDVTEEAVNKYRRQAEMDTYSYSRQQQYQPTQRKKVHA